MGNKHTEKILDYLMENPLSSSTEIFEGSKLDIGFSTLKRSLTALLAEGLIVSTGKLKAVRYQLSPAYAVLHPIEVDRYFEREQDERLIQHQFNLELMTTVLNKTSLFTVDELSFLNALQQTFMDNVSHLSKSTYDKEMERLAIDLSWKSSQIEGNTYSLLETERLLKEQEAAEGKPKDDATMLLNHKEAINFIIENPDYVEPLAISRIEDIHSLLIKNLGVDRNLRQRRVGISGTNYVPLDNEHQIRDAINELCLLINSKQNVFEKALLALVMLSYIQPFADGNKRTARIISNALLIAYQYCPISFRTVDSIEYKKAMLLFYEQNNIYAFKEIFKSQFEFAVKTYF
jgi:Fic family protein